MLQIYDTLNRKKLEFKPLKDNTVNMYVCGVTVYDYCHIGHARTYVAFDMVYKYLKFCGYKVNYVRNITDIDDKIINRANESNINSQDLANQFINIMHEDFYSLGLACPDFEPKATETIDGIISFIDNLLKNNHAYIGSNGDVYFSVRNYNDYGKLAHQSLENLQVGARVEQNFAKKDALDFVLWKMAKPNEPFWNSPWGNGRPGWHIECSAMSTKILGETIDIHGGGFDLKFPHHENERAQSEAKTGKKFVNYWMHTGFLQIDNEKMSKSLKNFLTIREVLSKYSPETMHCFLVMSHYRSEIHYSDQLVLQAKNVLDRFYTCLRELHLIKVNLKQKSKHEYINKYSAAFSHAMNDDFNSPNAFAVLFDIVREINKIKSKKPKQAGRLGYLLKNLAKIFGILQKDPETYMQEDRVSNTGDRIHELTAAEIEGLIQQREQARLNKEYARSDVIRNELLENGIILEDSSKGTTWRRK